VSLQSINPRIMKKQDKERYKRKTALAMYAANFSMRQIQEELGNGTVANIRDWSIKGIDWQIKKIKEKCARPKCTMYVASYLGNIGYCKHCIIKQRKKALRRAAQKNNEARRKARKNKKITETRWKKQVFASWKDTPEQAAFRRSPEYQQWRITVLERDKYTCQHCEATGGRLVVHHIKTFKMNPELRLSPDNGIVLCNTCHEKLHLSRVEKPRILKLA